MKKLITVGLIVGSIGAGVAGCGGSSSYPANLQANFLNSCEADGAPDSACNCALKYAEAHVSAEAFAADDAVIENGGSPKWIDEAVGACS